MRLSDFHHKFKNDICIKPLYQSTERGNEDVTMAGIGGLMSLTPVIGWTLRGGTEIGSLGSYIKQRF